MLLILCKVLLIFPGISPGLFWSSAIIDDSASSGLSIRRPVWAGRDSKGVSSRCPLGVRSRPAGPQTARSNAGPGPGKEGGRVTIVLSAGRRFSTIAPPSHHHHTTVVLQLHRGWGKEKAPTQRAVDHHYSLVRPAARMRFPG